jgi:hypothetical protein
MVMVYGLEVSFMICIVINQESSTGLRLAMNILNTLTEVINGTRMYLPVICIVIMQLHGILDMHALQF